MLLKCFVVTPPLLPCLHWPSQSITLSLTRVHIMLTVRAIAHPSILHPRVREVDARVERGRSVKRLLAKAKRWFESNSTWSHVIDGACVIMMILDASPVYSVVRSWCVYE